MSDQTDFVSNTNNSMDNCDSISCYLPRKRIKLTPSKNRNARSLTEKVEPQTLSNSWEFIEKNETMIAELSGGKLTLWQFLLELLMSDEYSNLIKWTDRNIGEFILIQAEEVAKLWGIRKDRNHRMNYDKLSRALRYYYQKNIIKKVHGHKFVYRFVSLVPESIAAAAGSTQKAITSAQTDLASAGQINQSTSDTETISNDTCSPRHNNNRITQPTLPNLLRFGNKNNKKTDFNSTLTALFQAAILSLSGSNQDLSPPLFNNHNKTDQHCSKTDNGQSNESDLTTSRLYDLPNQAAQSHTHECICKPDLPIIPPSPTLYFPSSSSSGPSLHMAPPSFDRQSMLHFSRHSINMQRLSQEILLNATSKSRFNPLLSPTVDSVPNSMDPTNHNFWLNQFANDLYKSTATNPTPRQVNTEKPLNANQPLSAEGSESPDIAIKAEKSIVDISPEKVSSHDESSNNLTALFQKFVQEFETKGSVTTSADSSKQYHNYCYADLANLIKSQLSSHSSFVWMPVPMNFAEEIMDFCLRSSSNQSSSSS